MTPINQNWIRWITASIAQHFNDVLASNTLSLYVEGQDRQTESQQNYVELRYDGPHYNRLSPTTFKLYVTINALIVGIKDGQSNIYKHEQNIGLTLTAFTNAITIYKYGNGPDDSPDPNNPLELGCMKLKPNPAKDIVIVSRFEQSVPSIKLREATIEAEYEMLITP